jgi:hypothetical protein
MATKTTVKKATVKRTKFPSVAWFEAVADITRADVQYQKFGRLNAVVAFKSGNSIVQANFDVLNIHEIQKIDEDEMRDCDFIIELEPSQWKDMLKDIKKNGTASLDWTLNTLDLKYDEPIHRNDLEDGFKADLFFRYLPSLQIYFDNSSQIATGY